MTALPPLSYGEVLTAGQWNLYFQSVVVSYGEVPSPAQFASDFASGQPSLPTPSTGSGPPYPRYAPGAAPGENQIGTFIIGESPIGTIPFFDPWLTVLSQYANKQAITSLITSFNAALDPTENMDNFFDFVWNLQTAQGFGLDYWGRIVGVSRVLSIPGSSTFLGFEEAGSSWTGFGQGGFYSGQQITTNFALSDADFRTLILAKAASNVCDGSIPGINAVLLALFPGRGDCYTVDGENMTMQYKFAFALTPVELVIVATAGILPKPVGVAATIVHP